MLANSKFVSWFVLAILAVAPTYAAAQAGQLDPTFGSNGVATTDFGLRYNQLPAAVGGVAIQTDGKIVVAGGVPAGNTNGFPSFAVARYQTNGALDASFGSGGIAITPGLFGNFAAVAIQTDGKIVAAGGASLVRYNANGSLDTSFGSGGILVLGSHSVVSAVTIEANGTIAAVAGNRLFLVPTNGSGTNFTLPTSSASAVVALAGGKLLIGSTVGFVFRYTSSGQLDTSFAVHGQMPTPGPANAITLAANQEILVAGSLPSIVTTPEPTLGFAVSGYHSMGVVDPKFAVNGGVVTPLSGLPTIATTGLGVEPTTGSIVVSGTATSVTTNGTVQDFGLARYTAAGQLDQSFGANGTVITNFTNSLATASGVAIQSDGKIIVAGSLVTPEAHGGTDSAFVIARYLAQ